LTHQALTISLKPVTAALALTLLAAADAPWKDKPFLDWTEGDARTVLSDSPWSKKVEPAIDRTNDNRRCISEREYLASDLEKSAAIKRAGKRDFKSSAVEILQRDDGLGILYLFPRSTEMTRTDKATFEARSVTANSSYNWGTNRREPSSNLTAGIIQ
jgi:hypothetical protein